MTTVDHCDPSSLAKSAANHFVGHRHEKITGGKITLGEWREKFEQCHEQFADDVSLRKRGLGRVDKDHNICGNLTRVRAQLRGVLGDLGPIWLKFGRVTRGNLKSCQEPIFLRFIACRVI